MTINKFYDTNALLLLQEKILNDEIFFISSETLKELENIKVSKGKTEDIKYKARKLLHILDENPTSYRVVIVNKTIIDSIKVYGLEDSPDNRICACAAIVKDVVFMVNDLNCKVIAKYIFGLNVESVKNDIDKDYTGYIDVTLSDEEMSYFYQNMENNIYDCIVNQYLIIRKSDGSVVDILRWTNDGYKKVCNKTIKSSLFGDKIKPKDVYQSCVIDSIMNNTITAISGRAGSGKSLLSLISIMSLIESGKYDRVVIMFNPTKTRGAADMGYYAGDALDKAMQSSIGSILTTKFGDRYAVDLLIQQDKLRLVSMADIRGMEVRDNEILYISETQNTTSDLLKLCLSRASSGCKIVIEGDYNSQVDSYMFDGDCNGMRRAIEVLKGEEEFGYVHLPNIWRSKIAALIDKM